MLVPPSFKAFSSVITSNVEQVYQVFPHDMTDILACSVVGFALFLVWNKLIDSISFFSFCFLPCLLSAAGISSLLRLWLAWDCVICLIFGCSCALSCQLNIRHIPTDSGTDFWPFFLTSKRQKRPMKSDVQVKGFRPWTLQTHYALLCC